MSGDLIKGAYYENEVQRVQKDVSNTSGWDILKVLKRRKVGNRKEVFVRYRGVGPYFDTWLPASVLKRKRLAFKD